MVLTLAKFISVGEYLWTPNRIDPHLANSKSHKTFALHFSLAHIVFTFCSGRCSTSIWIRKRRTKRRDEEAKRERETARGTTHRYRFGSCFVNRIKYSFCSFTAFNVYFFVSAVVVVSVLRIRIHACMHLFTSLACISIALFKCVQCFIFVWFGAVAFICPTEHSKTQQKQRTFVQQ